MVTSCKALLFVLTPSSEQTISLALQLITYKLEPVTYMLRATEPAGVRMGCGHAAQCWLSSLEFFRSCLQMSGGHTKVSLGFAVPSC